MYYIKCHLPQDRTDLLVLVARPNHTIYIRDCSHLHNNNYYSTYTAKIKLLK